MIVIITSNCELEIGKIYTGADFPFDNMGDLRFDFSFCVIGTATEDEYREWVKENLPPHPDYDYHGLYYEISLD